MSRLLASITIAVPVLVAALPARQQEARDLLRPATSNLLQRTLRFDPTTGALTRVTGIAESGGFEVVYDNHCPTGYFLTLNTQAQNGPASSGPMAAGDWGGVPGTGYGGSGVCTPGCADTYEIGRFTFDYCTTAGAPIDLVLHFWDRTASGGNGLNSCNGVQLVGGAVPPVLPRAPYPASATGMADLTLTGLPRSSGVLTGGDRACYAIQIQLEGPGFELSGGSSFPPLSVTGDRFSWSMQVTNDVGGTGPLLAGNALAGTPCTMCAGTIWEAGGMSADPGIGLGQDNHFWLDTYGGNTPTTGNCYFFGGNPWAGMGLTLEAAHPCQATATFCDASDGALAACPCANPGLPDTGCDNAQSTGGVKLTKFVQTTSPNGATLNGTGFPSVGSPAAVVLRSSLLEPGGPTAFGDGVRCIGVTPLVRMGADLAGNGVSTHTFGHGAGPGTFYYQLWYRNLPSGFCDPAAGFNLSNGTELVWP